MELVYSLSDIYPNSNNWETGSLANIDAEDKEVLEENYNEEVEVNGEKASFKKIGMAVLLIILMVIFFGVGGGK